MAVLLPAAAPLGPALRLIEIEIAAGMARLWIDGALQSSAACTWPNLLVDRVFAGHSAPFFSGQGGDVPSLITDGSPAADARAVTIRQALAARHGIALA